MKMNESGKKYWLDEKHNVRLLLFGLYASCAALFAADAFYHKHIILDFEHWFGFYGFYGFIACVALVLAAKILRKLISRPGNYYDDPVDGSAPK